jgi:hypothetical protein
MTPSTATGSSATPEGIAPELQQALEGLDVQIVRLTLRELKGRDKNPHYMTAAKYNRLVDNLKRDKVLTSTPLIYRGEILSGHHRVRAAIEAGIIQGFCIDILTELTEERKTSIQLSHNALVGDDDPSGLKELYEDLPLDEKLYSGLTDDIFKDEPVDIASLGAVAPRYEEVKLRCLPDEREVFHSLVKEVENAKVKPLTFVAHLSTFNELFDAIVGVKQQLNVHNTAMALKLVAKLATERLRQLETDGETDEAQLDDHPQDRQPGAGG